MDHRPDADGLTLSTAWNVPSTHLDERDMTTGDVADVMHARQCPNGGGQAVKRDGKRARASRCSFSRYPAVDADASRINVHGRPND